MAPPSYVDNFDGKVTSKILSPNASLAKDKNPSMLPVLYTSLWESIVAEPHSVSCAMLFSDSVTLETHCSMLQSHARTHVVDAATVSFTSLVGGQQDGIFVPGMLTQQEIQTVVIKYPRSLSTPQHRALLELLATGHYTGLKSISTINPPNIVLMFEADSIRKLVGEAMNDYGCTSLISAADLISPSLQRVEDTISKEGLSQLAATCESTQPIQSVSISQQIQAEIRTYAEKFHSHPSWANNQVLNSPVRTIDDTATSLGILTRAIARDLGSPTVSSSPHLLLADDLLKITYSSLANQQASQNVNNVFDWYTGGQGDYPGA